MRHATTAVAVRTVRVTAAALLLVVSYACETGRVSTSRREARDQADAAPYQAAVDEGLGAAVAILIAWRLGTFRDADRALTEDEATAKPA